MRSPQPTIEAVLRALEPAALAATRTRGSRRSSPSASAWPRRSPDSPAVERVWPSDANFLLVEFADAAACARAQASPAGLLVRDFARQCRRSRAALRITVGTPGAERPAACEPQAP